MFASRNPPAFDSSQVEYLYLDLGSLSFSAPGAFAGEAISGSAKFTDNIVRAGLNLRLN
jgi:hypothetical protein